MKNKKRLYSNLPTISLKDLYGYINEIEGGYINANYHPENNNIVILNYTKLTTYEKRWNKYTVTARGLILDLTDTINNGKIYVLAKPFEKFFNYGESLDYEKDIDFTKIESVMEKMDGSLGISYLLDGEIRFATRGSFTSEQAERATEIWRTKYAKANERYHQLFTDSIPTLLIEIIYPSNRIVVDYKGEEKLVLLGVIDNGADYHYKGVKDIGDYLNLPTAEQYEYTIDEMINMKRKISANEEGWVIRFNDNKRLKIKGDEYFEVHRVLHGLSDKARFFAWSNGTLDEMIMMIPEEFRDELESLRDRLDLLVEDIHRKLTHIYLEAIEWCKTKKEFAIHVNSVVAKEHRGFMFDAYNNGEISKERIMEHIYKNYKYYMEVIE